jgi:hypothetical protein
VTLVVEDVPETLDDLLTIGIEKILRPVERLDDPHGWVPSPVEPARRRRLKPNLLFAELDWAQARVGHHRDACRHRSR